MKSCNRRNLLLGALAAGAIPAVWSQDWPSSPIKVVVPWPAGGSVDVLARVLSQPMSEGLKQQIVVENRAGAAGNIGSDAVAKAAPDGYTLLLGSNSTHVMNPALFQRMPFKGVDDFTPIAALVRATTVLVAHPTVPAATVGELIVHARAKPGVLTYASAGVGSQPHLSAELFRKAAGVDIVHVPYKGSAQATVDVVGGQVHLMFTAYANVQEYVKAGKLKLLAVVEAERSPLVPQTPTIAETLPGFDVSAYYCLLGPAGMPRAIQSRLQAEALRVLSLPDVSARLQGLGLVAAPRPGADLERQLRTDLMKWSAIIKETGARAD